MPVARHAIALAVVLVACGGAEPRTPSVANRDHALARLLLRPGDVPEGMEVDPRHIGPIEDLRELLPPRDLVPNVPPVPPEILRGFRDGFETGFAVPSQLRAVPPPPRPGELSFATSSVVRFDSDEAASAFYDFFASLQVGPTAIVPRERLPGDGLGDEAYGWHRGVEVGGLDATGRETFGYVWRSGALVLAVTLGAAPGAADAADALQLARALDGRVSP